MNDYREYQRRQALKVNESVDNLEWLATEDPAEELRKEREELT